MEFVGVISYIQVGAFLFLFAYLGIGLYQVRLDKKVCDLMQAEVELPDGEEENQVYSHGRRGQPSLGFATEWEMLSWEEKIRYQKLENKLNRAAAVAGSLAFLTGFTWTYIEVQVGADGGLPQGWLILFSLLFLIGLGILFWSYYSRWLAKKEDYLDVKRRLERRRRG